MAFNPLTIITLVLSIILILLSTWYYTRENKQMAAFELLDLCLGTLAIFFILSRVLGLLYYVSEVVNASWSFLPVIQPDKTLLFFSTWPWLIFKITDGRFLFLETAGAFVIADIIFSFFHKRSINKAVENDQHYYRFGFLIPTLSLIPFFISAGVNSYLVNEFSPSLPVISILILLIVSGLVFFTVRDKVTLYLILLLTEFLMLVSLIVFKTPNANSLGGVFFIDALIILLTLMTLVRAVAESNAKPKVRTSYRSRRNNATLVK